MVDDSRILKSLVDPATFELLYFLTFLCPERIGLIRCSLIPISAAGVVGGIADTLPLL